MSDADDQEQDRVTSSGIQRSVEAESAERWVSGKSEGELISDLRAYLARLRDDPHNIQDRLRVAAIQLRLGRVEEALIHYEGVVRGYVANSQILSAIALCERILRTYPNLLRLQRLLAALYARAPRGTVGASTPVTPIEEEEAFLVTEPEEAATDRNLVVDRLFAAPQAHTSEYDKQSLLDDDDLRPTMPHRRVEREGEDEAIPLTNPKSDVAPLPEAEVEPAGDVEDEDVVLLTKPKRKTER